MKTIILESWERHLMNDTVTLDICVPRKLQRRVSMRGNRSSLQYHSHSAFLCHVIDCLRVLGLRRDSSHITWRCSSHYLRIFRCYVSPPGPWITSNVRDLSTRSTSSVLCQQHEITTEGGTLVSYFVLEYVPSCEFFRSAAGPSVNRHHPKMVRNVKNIEMPI